MALAGGGVAVGVDEPADGGVIIAALEVVEAGFIVLIVATIPQGVDLRHSAGRGQHLAVGVVGIRRHPVAVAVHQVHHITLEIRDVIVGGSGGTVVVNQGIGEASIVIPEIQGFGCAVAGNGLPQQLPTGVDVAVLLGDGGFQNAAGRAAGGSGGSLILQTILGNGRIRVNGGNNDDPCFVDISTTGASVISILEVFPRFYVVMPQLCNGVILITVTAGTFVKGIAILCTGGSHYGFCIAVGMVCVSVSALKVESKS